MKYLKLLIAAFTFVILCVCISSFSYATTVNTPDENLKAAVVVIALANYSASEKAYEEAKAEYELAARKAYKAYKKVNSDFAALVKCSNNAGFTNDVEPFNEG